MNKIKVMVKKLALLAVTALPLTSLADIARPTWDERVMVPACNMPEWLFIAGLAVIIVLMFVVMRRKGVPFNVHYVIVMMLTTAVIIALVALVMYYYNLLFVEERVIHHPEELPNHDYHNESMM